MAKHYFVETDEGEIHEIAEYFSPTTGSSCSLEEISDFDTWAKEVIHLSKVIQMLPKFLIGYLCWDITMFSLAKSRRAWVEEW